jgi:hypothetical protein
MMSILFLSLLGCAGNIHELYASAKEDALRPAGTPAVDWSPDIRAWIQPSQLNAVTTAALDAGLLAWKKPYELAAPLGLTVSITPSASIEALRIVPGRRCDGCLTVTSNISGQARWRAGSRKGSIPFTARFSGDVEVALEDTGDAFRLRARLTEIKRVKLNTDLAVLQIAAGSSITDWAREALRAAPAFTVAELGGDGLPLRAAALRIQEDGIFVDALSDVAGGPVGAVEARDADWVVRISEETVAALLRRAAFEAGTLDYEVAVDPQAIDVAGDRFTMTLRLWRLAGRGWWRDYSVEGGLSVENRKLMLRADQATAVAKSPGAGLADPIALLAERRILDAITDNLEQALPGTRGTAVQGLKVTAVTRSVEGQGGALVLSGNLRTRSVTE